jgi:dopamine receptor D1
MNNSSSSNGDEIVLNENGDIFNPVQIDSILMMGNFLCCLVGIPLNVSVALTIIHHRRLHRKPRNIFLLGIIFSNLSFFVPAVIKLIYWAFYSSEFLCQSYVAIVGVPQVLLSLNMLLALIDRYVAINHPLLHRKKMTVRLASAIVLLSSTLIVFLLKFIYIFDLVPLRCEVWLVHVKIVLIILIVMFTSSIALNVIVYRQTKNYLSESQCYTLLRPTTILVKFRTSTSLMLEMLLSILSNEPSRALILFQ